MSDMAVIYARQSLDRDGEGVAVGRQLSECRRLAESQGLDVTREFVDNDRSASKGNRPAFGDLLNAIRSGEVDTIICWHTDRLYRRVRDLVDLVELAEKHSLKIITVKAGDLDLNNSTGRMMAQIMGAVARQEVEHKGERQKIANLERAKKGQRQFSSRPFGYERVNGEIRIVEAEAAILRETINRFIAGESFYGIAKDFAARGIVGLNGRPMSYQNLGLRAGNPALAGVRTYLGDVMNEDGDWPSIIDKVTWERFQSAKEARKQGQVWDKKLRYLGSGIFRCGKCGDTMVVLQDWAHGRRALRQPVYQCRNFDVRRRLRLVDEMVETAVIDRLSQPDILAILSPSEDVSELAAESQDIRLRMDGLAALYADGTLSAAAVRVEKDKLQKRLDGLQGRIAAAEGGSIINDLASSTDIAAYWHNDMTIQQKRQIVSALMTVTIHPTKRGGFNYFNPEDVTITWSA